MEEAPALYWRGRRGNSRSAERHNGGSTPPTGDGTPPTRRTGKESLPVGLSKSAKKTESAKTPGSPKVPKKTAKTPLGAEKSAKEARRCENSAPRVGQCGRPETPAGFRKFQKPSIFRKYRVIFKFSRKNSENPPGVIGIPETPDNWTGGTLRSGSAADPALLPLYAESKMDPETTLAQIESRAKLAREIADAIHGRPDGPSIVRKLLNLRSAWQIGRDTRFFQVDKVVDNQ